MLPSDGPELGFCPFCVVYVVLTWLEWENELSTNPELVEPDMFWRMAIRLWYWAGVIPRPNPSMLFL